jgi:lipocalin
LGREPELSKEILEKIFSEAERRGFDTSKLL